MKKLEGEIRKYLEERKWDNLRPCDIAKSVSIEAAELLELFQWSNQSLQDVKKDKDFLEKIKKELADVFLYCLDMSVLLGFDSSEIILKKLEKVKEKYPAHLFQNRDKEADAGTEEIYWKIKKDHRMKGD